MAFKKTNGGSEAELDARARAAYRAFRAENFHTFWRIEDIVRWLRDRSLSSNYSKADNRHDVNVASRKRRWNSCRAPVRESTVANTASPVLPL